MLWLANAIHQQLHKQLQFMVQFFNGKPLTITRKTEE